MLLLRRLFCTRALQVPRPDSLLAPATEEISHIGSHVPPVFNFAYFVDRSDSLQQLIKLGVNLHQIEKKPRYVEPLLKLDFEKDIKNYIVFLNDYVHADDLGQFLTKNPLILVQDLDNLQTRINYLQSKKFDNNMIKRIVTKQPFWLMFSTMQIDKRLGHFQSEFNLKGNEVRALATKQPRLITYSMSHIFKNSFAIKEEMGFNEHQIKQLLLDKPKLWMINQLSLIRRFNYVHSVMNIPHEDICKMPQVLMCRNFRIKQRHEFLKKIGRAQYFCTKPHYISLVKLVEGTDAEFCLNVAKCAVSEFNLYLKSL